MKKGTKLFIAAVLAAGISTAAFGANERAQLQDISTYWGKTAVQYFYDHHYITGADGKFFPDEDITREGAAVIIDNMIGEDGDAPAVSYTDVRGRWSAKAIASLVDKQIMKGYSDNTFKPAQKIRREEFAVIAYNYMSYMGLAAPEASGKRFADESSISPWAKEAVDAMAAGGYMAGSQNRFHPQDYVTRGEAVNVLYRIIRHDDRSGSVDAAQDGAESAASETAAAVSSETAVETKVFKDITEVYGSVKKFADDGIMYWQADTLHIGVKTRKNRDQLETVLMDDKDLPADKIYLQTSRYSYNEYKKMMEQARMIYSATEATNAPVRTEVDYLNQKVVLIVRSISDETRANLDDALGKALRIVIQ